MEFSSSSSKKAKTPAGGNGMSIIVSCLVDGCTADLGQCREYHRRHKVCELHSKTPKVTIAGREQRFCQQCSRFHSLVEFDEGKRSCRKRLDGHNRRRRKPQSDPLSKTTTTFLSSQQGIARILSFNNPQIQSSLAAGSARPAPAGFKLENPIGPFNNQSPLNYLARHHLNLDSAPQNTRDNHFNFLQHQSLPLSVSSNQLNQAGNSRALSLLSSSPPTQQMSTIMPSVPRASIGQYGYGQEMRSESSGTTHQFQGMFNNGHANSSSSTGIKQQTLSFRWD